MEQNGLKNENDAKARSPPQAAGASKSPKKRRKVNHACVYCRRSHMTCDLERPCARCIKRNIGHLCHDERRDTDTPGKKVKGQHAAEGEEHSSEQGQAGENGMANTYNHVTDQGPEAMAPLAMPQAAPLQIVQPSPVSGYQQAAMATNTNQFLGYANDWLGAHNPFQDLHSYHPSYMYNAAPEVTNEYNLLNDFLNNSILDDRGLLQDDGSGFYSDPSAALPAGLNNSLLPASGAQTPSTGLQAAQQANALAISRPASTMPTDKTREYYLQAADPTGNDNPDERMQKLLHAKFEAGMLKPFNYVKGYARLSAYMDEHMNASSKQKILRQLDRFRPKFRQAVQALSDVQLLMVEMWFEQTLMEYDRVFASMAIPACCWRRTGEIFRGNKEMAELIHVPLEKLRDGKIAIHEILTEESLVNYWEKFGVIAFDQNQKALLTSCSLKNPVDGSKDSPIKCCFSFTIRRDENKIPSLIVGNFLPQHPVVRPP